MPKGSRPKQTILDRIISRFGREFVRTELFPGETNFFSQNQDIPGMVSDDGKVVMNPLSKLSGRELRGVLANELTRAYMRKNNIKPKFSLTEKQSDFFAVRQKSGLPGERTQGDISETIVGRLLSGDRTAFDTTPEQHAFTRKLLIDMFK